MGEPPSFVFFGSIFSLILGIGVLCALMLISMLIAASESSLFSLLPADLQQWKKGGTNREKMVVELIEDPIPLRITLLLLHITIKVSIVSLLIMLTWDRVLHDQSKGITIMTVSLFLIFLGELVPRVLAHKNNRSLSPRLAAALKLMVKICSPLVVPVIALRTRWKKVFRERKSSREELSQALELAAANDPGAVKEKEILRGIVNFGSLRVKDLMQSRESIAAFTIDSNFTELINYINQSGFSRIPVYRKSLDTIEGVLYIKDLLPFLGNGEAFPWTSMLRPGFFVSENKKIDLLLKDFQEKRVHMAIVRDERGLTTGLIALEDLIEEIIGGINDESPEVPNNGFRKIDENTFVFDGGTPIQEFFRALDQEHPFLREPGDHESLEDFIIEFHDELPGAGDELYYEQFTFVIEAVEQKRIKRVRVNVHAQA